MPFCVPVAQTTTARSLVHTGTVRGWFANGFVPEHINKLNNLNMTAMGPKSPIAFFDCKESHEDEDQAAEDVKLSHRKFESMVKTMKIQYSLSHIPESEWPRGVPLSEPVDTTSVVETSSAMNGKTPEEAVQHRTGVQISDIDAGKHDEDGVFNPEDSSEVCSMIMDQAFKGASNWSKNVTMEVDWTAQSVKGSCGEATRYNDDALVADFETVRTSNGTRADQASTNRDIFGEDCDTQPLPYIANGSSDSCNTRCRFFINLTPEEKMSASPKATGLLSLSEVFMVELRHQKSVLENGWVEDHEGFTTGSAVDMAMREVACLIKKMCGSETDIKECKLKRAHGGHEKCLMMALKWNRVQHGAHLMRVHGKSIVKGEDGLPTWKDCPPMTGKTLNSYKYGNPRHYVREATENDIRLLHSMYHYGYIQKDDVRVALADMTVYSQWISEREKKAIVGSYVMMLKPDQFGLHVQTPKEFENWCRSTYLNFAQNVFSTVIFGESVSTINKHDLNSSQWITTEIKGAMDRVLFNITDCLLHTRAAYLWSKDPDYAVLTEDGRRIPYDHSLSPRDQPGRIIPLLVLPPELSTGEASTTWFSMNAFHKKLDGWREEFSRAGKNVVSVQSVVQDSKFSSKGRVEAVLQRAGIKNAGEIAAITRQLDNDGRRTHEAITIQYFEPTFIPPREEGVSDEVWKKLLKGRCPQVCISRTKWCFSCQGHLTTDASGLVNGLVRMEDFHYLTINDKGHYVPPTLRSDLPVQKTFGGCTTLMRRGLEIMKEATLHEVLPMGGRAARLDEVNKEQLLGDRPPVKGVLTMRGFETEHRETQSMESMIFAQTKQAKFDKAAIEEHSRVIVNHFFSTNFDTSNCVGLKFKTKDVMISQAFMFVDDAEDCMPWFEDLDETMDALNVINAEYCAWFDSDKKKGYVASEEVINAFGVILMLRSQGSRRGSEFGLSQIQIKELGAPSLASFFSEMAAPFANAQGLRDGPRDGAPSALKSSNVRVLPIQDTPNHYPKGGKLHEIIEGRRKSVEGLHAAHVKECETKGVTPQEFDAFVAITRNIDSTTYKERRGDYIERIESAFKGEDVKLEELGKRLRNCQDKADKITDKTSKAYSIRKSVVRRLSQAHDVASKTLNGYRRHLAAFKEEDAEQEEGEMMGASKKRKKNPIHDEWTASEAKRRLTSAQQAALVRLQRRNVDVGVFTSGDRALNSMISNIHSAMDEDRYSDVDVQARLDAARAVGMVEVEGGVSAEMETQEGNDYDGDPIDESQQDFLERNRVEKAEDQSVHPIEDDKEDAEIVDEDEVEASINKPVRVEDEDRMDVLEAAARVHDAREKAICSKFKNSKLRMALGYENHDDEANDLL